MARRPSESVSAPAGPRSAGPRTAGPRSADEQDLDLLLACLPPAVGAVLDGHGERGSLLEVVLDLGRPPEARFTTRTEDLASEPVSRDDLAHVVSRVGRFGKDNRAGIERTLHRISALRNRVGDVVGLTCRVGRAVHGTVDILRDVIEGGHSLLLLGRPGVGKTTLLREAARVLATELGKRVVVVDTSNEIAGDGDIPHPGIGRARRLQVPSPDEQHAVMIEAVENHMPEVVVIDEIGTAAEALAARTIAERGVQLVATAHGRTLDNLLQNPTLSDLVGGIQAVTLSDEEARRRGTQKTVLERRAPPTFDVLVEIHERDRLAVHHDVAETVDRSLRGYPSRPELRVRTAQGEIEIQDGELASSAPDERHGAPELGRLELATERDDETYVFTPDQEPPPAAEPRAARLRTATGRFAAAVTPAVAASPAATAPDRLLRVFPYAVSRSKVDHALTDLGLPARVVREPEEADVVLTVKLQERRQPLRLRELQARGVRVVVLKANTVKQVEGFLREEFGLPPVGGRLATSYREAQDFALREAEEAIDEVMASGRPVELAPQDRGIRRLQHEMVERAGLTSRSRGDEPYRKLVVYPA
jgi:stage III sporulation protein SpoIIIAA